MKFTHVFTLSALLLSTLARADLSGVEMTVHKSPTCGCCQAWVDQLPSDVAVTIEQSDDLIAVKEKLGVASNVRACHTAVTKKGFVFEGHVPNAAIRAFLAAPPAGAIGLAVPGMPVGSQGMEVGDKTMRYPIMQLNRDAKPTVWAYAEGKTLLPNY
ncbi:MAG: DUF411 domain-containing protein [Pseudomonadales bacterium]